MDQLSRSIAAKFKSKKKIPGSDTAVYEYSPQQIARRNNEKAERLEKLRGKIGDLRAQVKKDLTSSDTKTFLVALVVGLMDTTYERVGNEASAKGEQSEDGKPHLGVTGWGKKNITFKGSKAHIKYIGKSGVKHDKEVDEPYIVKALKKAYEACDGDSIFHQRDVKVTADSVNEFLKKYDITAKDIRGLNANLEMKKGLKEIRSKNGKLPEDKKEREGQLKKEFKEVLEATAKIVGHTPSMLKSSYLTPGLEDEFMKSGQVSEKMKLASLVRRFKGSV